MKKKSKKSEMVVKQILLPLVVGAACVWLLLLLWNFSEVGMMRRTLEIIEHKPEKVYVDFPESKIFAEKIFYQNKIKSTLSSVGPLYQQEVSFEDFLKLNADELYAISSHKVIEQKLKVTLTGSAVDGVMRYYTAIEKEIDIPEGERFIDLRYVDGSLEISQQPDIGDASWRLVVERLIYFIVIAVLLALLFIESLDRKNAENRESELRGQLHDVHTKRDEVMAELVKVKKELDEKKRQTPEEGGDATG